jgi:hypothetical protein
MSDFRRRLLENSKKENNLIYIFNTSSTTDATNGPFTYSSKVYNKYHFGEYTTDTWYTFQDTSGQDQGLLSYYTANHTLSKSAFTPADGSLFYDMQTTLLKSSTSNEAICGKSPVTTITMGESGSDAAIASFIRFRFFNSGQYKVGVFYTDTSETTAALSLSKLKFRIENGTDYVETDFSDIVYNPNYNTSTIVWSEPLTINTTYTYVNDSTINNTTNSAPSSNADNSMYFKIYTTQYYSRPKASFIVIQKL